MTRFSSSMLADAASLPVEGFIELALDENGRLLEVEFHISTESIPPAVRRAVNAKIPGGVIVGCEKEYQRGILYYEVIKEVDGREYEVMVTPTGRLHMMEFAIEESNTPAEVLAAADRAVPWGRRTSVERILDRKERLIEYQVKKVADGLKYKILIGPDGVVKQVFREIRAEIEIPIKTVR